MRLGPIPSIEHHVWKATGFRVEGLGCWESRVEALSGFRVQVLEVQEVIVFGVVFGCRIWVTKCLRVCVCVCFSVCFCFVAGGLGNSR